jgi:hypothetical protein
MKAKPALDVLKISGAPARSKKELRAIDGNYAKEEIIHVA